VHGSVVLVGVGEECVTLFERGEKSLADVTSSQIENVAENIPCHRIRQALY
jgi:hypothetical protein